jgi:hypothetical protein
MPGKIRTFIAFILVAAYVLTASGCAAAWFLVGAGSAATAAAVMDENKKQSRDDIK